MLLLLAACTAAPDGPSGTGEAIPAPPTGEPRATETGTSPAVPTPTLFATPTAAPATPRPTSEPTATEVTAVETIAPATLPPPTSTGTPAPTPCASPGRIEYGQYNTSLAGPLAYRVYLPPCYGLDGRVYPTLYLLGGNIHDDSIWDKLGADEAAEAGIAAGLLPPFIIVMPDGGWVANETSGGPRSYESVILEELIPTIEQAYCAWPDRAGRAIGGLSRGGYWSLEIAFRQPQLFRSVGAHSAALIDSHAGPDLNPINTGVSNDLDDLRIWLDFGERDPYLVEARPLRDGLVAAGVDHVWLINPGQHDEPYWIANLPAYLAWYSDVWAADRVTLPLCHPTD